MGGRLHQTPSFDFTGSITFELCTPHTPALGIRVVRCNGGTTGLAPTASLVRFTRNDIEVELGLMRCGVDPGKVTALEVQRMHEWTTCVCDDTLTMWQLRMMEISHRSVAGSSYNDSRHSRLDVLRCCRTLFHRSMSHEWASRECLAT